MKPYAKLTPKMMVQLAAPHTWVAAILPCALSCAIASVRAQAVSLSLALAVLGVAILMQAGVNTLNDYADFKKGADTEDNQLDPTDAVLVYNNVNPKHVLAYFVALMAVALVLGLYVVWRTSWISLAIGVFAMLVILAYSMGKHPLSYLPLGELASGFTMGGLITLAGCYALTGEFSLMYLVYSLPIMVGIGFINFTNNACDIEKDIQANRKTMPVILGREKMLKLYRGTVVFLAALAVLCVGVFFTNGLPVAIVFLFAVYPFAKALRANPLTLQTRGMAMSQVLMLNICVGVFYALAVAVSATPLVVI